MEASRWSEDAIRRAVARFPIWYHVLDLHGVETPGVYDMRPSLAHFHFPARLDGRRVADVGAATGFFSFHFERLGAADVAAVDLPSWAAHDYPRWYRRRHEHSVPPGELARIDRHNLYGPFRLARRVLGSRVRPVRCRIYELPEHAGPGFDLVFCNNVLAHVRDPVAALESLRESLCEGGLAILGISIDTALPPSPCARFDGRPESLIWWIPSAEGARALCLAAGFASVEPVSIYEVSTLRGPPATAVILVLHARV